MYEIKFIKENIDPIIYYSNRYTPEEFNSKLRNFFKEGNYLRYFTFNVQSSTFNSENEVSISRDYLEEFDIISITKV